MEEIYKRERMRECRRRRERGEVGSGERGRREPERGGADGGRGLSGGEGEFTMVK